MALSPSLTVPQAREKLREAELRSTSCRVAVLQFLSGAAAPQSHADVADRLVPQGFDKSTIYRCLTEMADAGLLTRLDLGDHVWRFEYRSGKETAAEHPHFVCVDCGKVACLPEVQVKFGSTKAAAAVPLDSLTEILLKGHCRECQ